MDYFNIKGKVIIITGGSRGLGRAMSLGFGEAGAKVVVVSRSKQLIEETADEIIKKGGEAIAIPADVKSVTDIEKVAKDTIDKFGRVDVLVNNAGVGAAIRALDMPMEEWHNVIDTNLTAILISAKAVVPKMIEQRYGKIINISSVMGIMASPTSVHYCTSKAGIIHMTRALAMEWARYNINVNCIAPGYFEVGLGDVAYSDKKQAQFLNNKIAFRRLGRPEELIGTAIFLASDASSYITGETIVVDGGYSLW